MKTSFTKIRRIVAASAIAAVATLATAGVASAQTQQNNQLALQLGAIQLGYVTGTNAATTNNLTTQQLANALVQGQQALLAKTTNLYTTYVATNGTSTNSPATNQPVAQSSDFRAELYQATLNALNSPILNTNKYTTTNTILVTVYNPKTAKFTTNKITSFGLNPVLTTPTTVMAITTARIPDLGPGLISNAVAATVSYTTNSFGVVYPVWGPQPAAASVNKITNVVTQANTIYDLNKKTATTQLNNAAAAAKAALTAAVKNYATGTTQWAAIPKAGTTQTNSYLPNFSTKGVGTNTLTIIPPNLKGLADSAAAVAANAINALGAINTNTVVSTNNTPAQNTATLYGKTAVNVQTIAKSLTQAAAAYQKTSTTSVTINGNLVPTYASGALSASSLGLISQVSSLTAGVANDTWGSSTGATGLTAILVGVVKGAVSAVGVTATINLDAIATGIAQGFYATYLRTFQDNNPGQTPLSATQFEGLNSNAAQIENAFSVAGVKSTTILAGILAKVNAGIGNVYQAYSTGNTNQYGAWNFGGTNAIAGAAGINLTTTNSLILPPLLNGVGTPVTDTVGLQ